MANQKPKIVVSEKLKKRLDSIGSKGDTYEDILWKLITSCKGVKK
jgi:hypothetical protein